MANKSYICNEINFKKINKNFKKNENINYKWIFS